MFSNYSNFLWILKSHMMLSHFDISDIQWWKIYSRGLRGVWQGKKNAGNLQNCKFAKWLSNHPKISWVINKCHMPRERDLHCYTRIYSHNINYMTHWLLGNNIKLHNAFALCCISIWFYQCQQHEFLQLFSYIITCIHQSLYRFY